VTADPAPNRRTFAWFVLGVATFSVYGSLVPFEFRSRSWDDATDAFVWAMGNRTFFESRSDVLANLLLGVPLGFGLLGLMFVDRPENRRREIVLGLIVLPGCLGFAAIIEFLQLLFPLRTCAGSDVFCQGFGAAVGMLLWIAIGRRLVVHARAFWSGSGPAGHALLAYLALLVVIQTLPLDLNPSPKDVYKKLRDEARFIPFGEFATSGNLWEHAAKLARTFGLFLPVGLLLGTRPLAGKQPFLLAFALAIVLEGMQVFVRSRVPSASDAVIGAIGIIVGRGLVRWRQREAGSNVLMDFGPLWLMLLFVIWGPYPYRLRIPPVAFDWMPGLPLESGNPLFTLEEMLVKLVLFALGGAMLGASGEVGSTRTRTIAAALLGIAVSGGLEALQTKFGSHSPSITDVILGWLGAFAGAIVTSRGDQPPFARTGECASR